MRYRNFARGSVLPAALFVLTCTAQAQTVESITVLGAMQHQPLSVSSLAAETLQTMGINGLSNLGQAVPGLRVDAYGAGIQPTLRGVGVQNVQGPGVESDVAVYVDGFRQNNLDSLLFDFADVARVDVLKGPQGTGFGQNATAGAILITTADPSFTTGAGISLSYGAFNDVRVRGRADIALTDRLAASLSVYHRGSENYFTDITTGKPSAPIESLALRGKLLFQPDADTRLVLAAQYTDMDDPTALAYVVGNPSAALYRDAFGVPMVHTNTPYRTSLNRALRNNPRTWSLSLTGAFELGWGTLASRSQFRGERGAVASDLDGTSIAYWNLDYTQNDQTLTQEFDLAGRNDVALRWHGGAVYSNDLGDLTYHLWQDVFSAGATSLLHSQMHVTTDTFGLFGDLDYDLADGWTLSAGARFSHERKSMRSALLMAPFIPGSGAKDWNELTPKVALSHALDENSNIYASATQGFKSGNYNYIGAGPQAPVKAEHVTQYEAGYRHDGGSWSLHVAAYYAQWRDLQAFTFQSSCGCFQFANAPHADVHGAEAEAQLALDENFSLRAAVAYTHARYRQFVGEAPTGAPFVPPFYGYATGPKNFAGDPMIRSPDWSGNLGLDWHRPSDIGTWSATAGLYLTSTVPFTPDRQLAQSGHGLLNLTAGWTAPDQQWSVLVSGENVLDQRYQNFSAEGLLGHSIIYGAPRSWRLKLERRI